jgi:hypothetical protein
MPRKELITARDTQNGWDEMAVLDVMDKKDRAERAAQEIMMEGDFSLSDLLVPAAAGAVGTIAATATYAALSPRSRSGADLGSAGQTAAALALGIPLTALAAYSVYKVAEGLPASESPWLYKMNPSYWFKTSAEKRYLDIEKKRGSRNVNLDRELAAAERAYRTSSSAASKESQIAPIQAGLKSQGAEVGAPFVGPLRSDNLPFVHFPGTWDAPGPKRDATDKALMSRIRRAGRGAIPRKGDRFDFRQAKGLFDIVDGYFRERPDYHLMDTERWMARYVESMGITYTDHDGKVYNMKGKIRVPVQTSLGAAPPRDPSIEISRALASVGLPIAPGTTYTYEQNLRAAEVVRGLMGKNPDADKIFRTWVERREITWVNTDGAVKGYRSGRVYTAAPPAPLDVALKTSKGLKTANVMGGDGLFVGAVTLSGGPSKFLKVVAGMQAPKIIAAAKAAGLAGKKVWTAEERDKVALGLLKSMKSEFGKNPGPGDARIARETVAAWAVSHGVKVPSADTTSGGTDVGIEWWKLNPIYGAAWLGKKAVTSTVKAVKSVFGKKKSPSAHDRRMLALKAAASAQAASKARILAAEKKHEAAIAEREEEKNIAEAEAKAADAEAAAREAEAIAITAEAEKGLRGTAQAVEGNEVGWTVTGWSVTGRGTDRWSAIGRMPPKYVGKFARVGASNTPKGQSLRFAAHVADSANADRRTCADVKAVTKQARMGHALARKQLSLINMGAVASFQATQALATNANQKRAVANGWKKRLVTFGTANKAIRLPRLLSFGTALGWWKNPVQFGTPRWIKKLTARNGQRPAMTGAELMGLAPKVETKLPPVPGEPADVLVSVTAAAKTMGVPAPVAMSMVAAAKSGVPDAQRQITEATKVYLAAQQGDKAAKAQIASVQADSKGLYGPALQKAAALAAAVGLAKGRQQYAARKDARTRAAKHVPAATAEATRARKAGYVLGAKAATDSTAPAPSQGFFEKLFSFQASQARQSG